MTKTPPNKPVNPFSADVEALVTTGVPGVEVLLAEVVSGATLRVFIDRADGVSLADCEQVTRLLSPYRDRYSVEVSSPGEARPLTKPGHFRRFLGRRAQLRLRDARDGHVNVTGELVGASEHEVTVAADEGLVSIPYERIARSNLVPGD